MADKLGKVMQALDAGKAKEGLGASLTKGLGGSSKGPQKVDVKHTWKTNAFGTVGSPRAKKLGSGKH